MSQPEHTTVPNQHPATEPGAVRLAVVGEAPAVEELAWALCAQGHGFSTRHWLARQLVERPRCPRCGSAVAEHRPTPFVGESGRLLNDLLAEAGLPRDRVFVGNVSRQPLGEGEKTLAHCGPGLARVAVDLEEFKPNAVLTLGNLALSAFMGEGHSVSQWRGSIYEGGLEGRSYKCVAALHPAAVLREPSQLALLRFDVARAVDEAVNPALLAPARTFRMGWSLDQTLDWLADVRRRQDPVGFDIEGGVDVGVTVCSLASSAECLSIPLRYMDWSRVWSKEAEATLWGALRAVLEDGLVTKVCHNALYEAFTLRWLHSIDLHPVEDTMLAWHVLYPELDKSLDVVASVLTRQPYWGTPSDWTDDTSRDTYNCIDSAVTLECWTALRRELSPAQLAFYHHSRDLIAPVLSMMTTGMNYDHAARELLASQVRAEVAALQGELDMLAGIRPPSFEDVADAVCFARAVAAGKVRTWADIPAHAKPSFSKPLRAHLGHAPASIDKRKLTCDSEV